MTERAQHLRRVFALLQLLKTEFEWMALDSHPDRAKKINKVYIERGVGWILRDLLTSTPSAESYNAVFADLNSEKLKDLGLFLEIGVNCDNLSELIEVIEQCKTAA